MLHCSEKSDVDSAAGRKTPALGHGGGMGGGGAALDGTGGGYLTSTLSVFLLAVPGIKASLEQPVLAICLAAGILTSIGGMLLRWRSHRLEQKEHGD